MSCLTNRSRASGFCFFLISSSSGNVLNRMSRFNIFSHSRLNAGVWKALQTNARRKKCHRADFGKDLSMFRYTSDIWRARCMEQADNCLRR